MNALTRFQGVRREEELYRYKRKNSMEVKRVVKSHVIDPHIPLLKGHEFIMSFSLIWPNRHFMEKS